MSELLTITIGLDHLVFGGNFALSWHGVTSALGIAVAIMLAVKPGYRVVSAAGLKTDIVSNAVIVVVAVGLVGARIVHVVDNWGIYSNNLVSILYIWNGGIGLWGGILGAYIGGAIYAYFAKIPWPVFGQMADVSAIPALAGQTVGRIGDIINGEHCARVTELPWGVIYNNSGSPGYSCVLRNDLGDPLTTAVHPAVGYEMIWNLLGIGVLLLLRNRIHPSGSLFLIYLLWYSIGRFAIQWLRLDPVYFLGLQEAHLIAIGVALAAIWFIIGRTRWGKEPPLGRRARR